jgi:hypothetical protein
MKFHNNTWLNFSHANDVEFVKWMCQFPFLFIIIYLSYLILSEKTRANYKDDREQ